MEQKIIDGVIVGKNRYYCSQECRQKDNRGIWKYFAIVFGIPMYLLLQSDFGRFVLSMGVLIAIFAYFARRRIRQVDSQIVRNVTALINAQEGDEMVENQESSSSTLDAEYYLDLSDEEVEELVLEENLIAAEPDEPIEITPTRMDPEQDGQVYSDILQDYVDPCCYQSARLSDKYCMCGKALVYPTTNQKET